MRLGFILGSSVRQRVKNKKFWMELQNGLKNQASLTMNQGVTHGENIHSTKIYRSAYIINTRDNYNCHKDIPLTSSPQNGRKWTETGGNGRKWMKMGGSKRKRVEMDGSG